MSHSHLESSWRKALDRTSRFTPIELAALAEHARGNLIALLRGATPSLYAPNIVDGGVSSVELTVTLPQQEPRRFHRIAGRPVLPLQGTLFGLCELAVGELRTAQVRATALTSGTIVVSVS